MGAELKNSDLTLVPQPQWAKAQERAAVIRPLSRRSFVSRRDVLLAAQQLGISERQVYRLVCRCREGHGELTAFISARSGGGRGKSRLAVGQDALIVEVIEQMYLTPQRRSMAAIVQEVRRRADKLQMRPPSASTVRRRIATLPLVERARRGDVAVPEIVTGPAIISRLPLDFVQMDHTPVDLILVDPIERKPIGRPWITVAIDVFSRTIGGFHVSLEPPSATSVGLCLAQMAADKQPYLQEVGIEADWPVVGRPKVIGVDNAKEFHSEAFERGCAQHDIAIDWRPPGRPQVGGIVERVIGTLMELVHSLPGTTFSNVMQRGNYDSDKAACLTLGELERWLTVAIAKYYHLRPHAGLDGEPPLHRFRAGLGKLRAEGRALPAPRNPRRFLIDFLPVIRRCLRREGIVIDHIHYFCDALKPWIERQETAERVLIRRNPRDLSRIYLLDTEDGEYLEIPYSDLSRPPISLWEHRLARARLRQRHRLALDERALFEAIEEMRVIETQAKTTTRGMRRNQARRSGLRVVEGTPARREAPRSTGHVHAVEAGNPLEPFEMEKWE